MKRGEITEEGLGRGAILTREMAETALTTCDPALPSIVLGSWMQLTFGDAEVLPLGGFLDKLRFSCAMRRYGAGALQ